MASFSYSYSILILRRVAYGLTAKGYISPMRKKADHTAHRLPETIESSPSNPAVLKILMNAKWGDRTILSHDQTNSTFLV
jgi:hypothetical protein